MHRIHTTAHSHSRSKYRIQNTRITTSCIYNIYSTVSQQHENSTVAGNMRQNDNQTSIGVTEREYVWPHISIASEIRVNLMMKFD